MEGNTHTDAKGHSTQILTAYFKTMVYLTEGSSSKHFRFQRAAKLKKKKKMVQVTELPVFKFCQNSFQKWITISGTIISLKKREREK